MKFISHPLFIPCLIPFLIFLLVLDNFLLPTSELVEIKDRAYIKSSHAKRRYESFFFVSETNHHYHVPENVFGKVSAGESFIIHQSFIIKKPLKITWCKDDLCYTQPMGTMNTTWLSEVLFSILTGYSFLCILLHFIKPGYQFRTHWKVVALGLTLGLFVFYLIF